MGKPLFHAVFSLRHWKLPFSKCNGYSDFIQLHQAAGDPVQVERSDGPSRCRSRMTQPHTDHSPEASKHYFNFCASLCLLISHIAHAPRWIQPPPLVGGAKVIFLQTDTAQTHTYTCSKTFADHHSAAHTVSARARLNKIDQVRDTFSGWACAHPELHQSPLHCCPRAHSKTCA